jgi:iron complex outermembrane recepter protein
MTCARAAAPLLMAMFAAPAIVRGQSPAPQPPQPVILETVEVVATTPIDGLGISRDKIPSNVQSITAEGLGRTGGVSTAEQLTIAVPSVHANEATTNPFQPDLQFRGFVGSPLLGLPQGLAVYQNGVRLNESFGDTVNWDAVPSNAIATVTLMSGSNPLFGLNALGGAVSVQTKTGFSHVGHGFSASAGSFGRYLAEAETGGNNGRLSYFVAGSALTEDGWREFSPSRVRQLFGDVGWRSNRSVLNATITTSVNRLIGNGPVPIDLLDEDRSAIFTHPDETDSKMTLLTLRGRHAVSPTTGLDTMVYYRRASIETLNGDDSDYDECEESAGLLCSDEGDGPLVVSQSGAFIPVGLDELNGTNNTSGTITNGWGGGLQATVVRPLSGRPNHFVTGLAIDGGRSRYEADTEIARLTGDRGTIGTGLFDAEAAVRLNTRVAHAGLYAANFFTVTPALTVMGAARFNYSDVTLRDRNGSDLDGDHSFSRLNPAAGLTYSVPGGATVYASFSMSSRVPAPSELSCADPEDPCRLPNAFVADPPLEQVVARTWEGGIRGRRSGIAWNASLFTTGTRDDIMFISSGPRTNTGHFQNVGDTRRRGIEMGATGVAARSTRWGVGYSYLRARFETPLTLSGPNHPDEQDGEIDVETGSRIPGVPEHNLKANLSTTIRRLTIGGSLLSTSNQYLRGDEANLLPAIRGFSLVSLTAAYALARHVAISARVMNLLDSEHSTFGLLGEADEVLGDDYDDPRFLSPAAPRAAWIGLDISFR